MRIFYSELTANPSLYSFGYSVYGEREESDDLDDCYDKGFLPFVGTQNQDRPYMYMGRGTRVRISEFVERHYHARVRRKVQSYGSITSELHELSVFSITPEFISFILTYFRFRFGKESMSETRLRAMLSSGFITHIREYKKGDTAIAYILEVHGDLFVHTWYHAYSKDVEGTHVGAYLYIDLLEKLKVQGTTYLYLGITYGNWMAYKTHYQPLEFWNGQEWISDPNSKKLKSLLKADSTRLLTFTDAWRESLEPFYKAPFTYSGWRFELRILSLVIYGLPKMTILLMLVLLGIFSSIVFQLL